MDNLFKLVYVLGMNLDNEMTIRQLSIDSKVPYTTTYRLIKLNKSLFNVNLKGNIKLCSLNLEDNITKNYLILAERFEANKFLKKNVVIKALISDLIKGNYALILFGSRVESTHREKSDVDICVINKDGKKFIDFHKFELIHKLEVNSLFFSRKEFKLMLKEKDHNVGKEILRKHIILYGEEYFWNVIWNN
jgi:predicted nucleotidyltransferase